MSRNERSPFQEEGQKKPVKRLRNADQRVRRTQERLGSAVIRLIQEKPMEDVTVQEVLDLAAVGRSTFYLHFRDKNDLLLSQLETFLEMISTRLSVIKEESQRVAPVTEMFAHIGSQKTLCRALADSGYLAVFFDLAQGYFGRGIEQRLREMNGLAKIPPGELAARGVALAGSLLALLRWWLARDAKETPAEMDRLFHRIVWNGVQ
jgi:AcrR family transcriptional regulator